MEEILSSIKRIIAEEGDGVPGRQRRQSRAATLSSAASALDYDDLDEEDEILELSDPMPMVERPSPRATRQAPSADPAPIADPVRQPVAAPQPVAAHAAPQPIESSSESPNESIVSRETMAASRAPLEALTRLMVKPETGSDGTLEGLVREMLRPMLREWMDANLPDMVEDMVAREIAKITGQPG